MGKNYVFIYIKNGNYKMVSTFYTSKKTKVFGRCLTFLEINTE